MVLSLAVPLGDLDAALFGGTSMLLLAEYAGNAPTLPNSLATQCGKDT